MNRSFHYPFSSIAYLLHRTGRHVLKTVLNERYIELDEFSAEPQSTPGSDVLFDRVAGRLPSLPPYPLDPSRLGSLNHTNGS